MKKIIKRTLPSDWIKYLQKRKSRWTNKVQCPLCNSSFKEFEPFGIKERKNARCPGCGALERHRLIWLYLKKSTSIFSNDTERTLLHFAPEGFFTNRLANIKNLKYIPADLFPELYQQKNGPKVEKVDITEIPFENESFDFILCNHVLEHIPDDAKAMNELYRVMKKGGWGIFQVPLDKTRNVTYEDFSITDPEEREKAFGQSDHVRWYGNDYKNRLEKAGFKVIRDNFASHFTKRKQFKFGLDPAEDIYLCQK